MSDRFGIRCVENWLREPPRWFLDVCSGIALGLFVLGMGLMIWGLGQLA